jgi:hypothetical protein
MIFEIPYATPSNNLVMRMHHRNRTREHNACFLEVRAAVGTFHPCFETCDITITRHGNRLIDFDNMGGGLKFLMDAMVKNKIIVDDSPKHVLSLRLFQEKCKKKDEKTVVSIACIE